MNRTFASFAPYALYCPIRPERAEVPCPGHRPGLLRALVYRPVRAKALKLQAIYKAFALTGRVFKIYQFFDTFFASKYKLIRTKSTC